MALVQVVLIGAVLGIAAFFVAQFMMKADQNSMRAIRRNDNLNFSTTMSDYVNDREVIRRSSIVVNQVGAGAVILYP